MKEYRVLWFDDCHETQEPTKDEALVEGITLVGYSNAQDGLRELQNNLFSYDAVLVDGLFYSSNLDSGDAVNDNALFTVARFLDKMEDKKKIPWFILSGQASFTKEANRIAVEYKENKVYDKNSDEDFKKLWNDIKREADKQIETQIKHRYQNVFDVCSEEYIGVKASKYLIDILCSIECPEAEFDDEKYFNGIRKVVELVFRASNKIGLLHDKCIPNDIVNLTWSSLFMAGKEIEIKPSNDKISCAKSHFPLLLANNVKAILDITSAASHTEGEEKENGKVNFADYKKLITSNYLLYSLVFQVMDLLLWFKKYADENPDKEENKLLWKTTTPALQEGDWVRGEITRIADNGFGTFLPLTGGKTVSIVPAKVKEYSLREKQVIEVTITNDSSGTKQFIQAIREV